MQRFANFLLGRIILHLICALRAGHWRWHCAGSAVMLSQLLADGGQNLTRGGVEVNDFVR